MALTFPSERTPSSSTSPPTAEPSRLRRRRIAMPNTWGWLGIAAGAFMVLCFVAPMVYALIQTFTDPSPVTYHKAVTSELFLNSLWLTFEMAIVVTVLCIVLAYPFAYAMARASSLIRAILTAAVMISFWTSFLVRTFSWQVLLGNSGVINDTVEKLGFVDHPIQMLHTSFAVDVAMVHILAPFLILAIYAQLKTIPIELELAAQAMGARPSVAFWRVTFPLTLPGVFAGAVLVFVMAIGFYVTPQILGDSGKFYLGQVIVVYVEKFFEFGTAAAMSVILLAVVLIILAIAARLVGIRRLLGIGITTGEPR